MSLRRFVLRPTGLVRRALQTGRKIIVTEGVTWGRVAVISTPIQPDGTPAAGD